LGELLTVDLSLTNHTHPTLTLDGKDDGSEEHLCSSYSLRLEQTGGTSPYYALYTKPVPFMYSCGVQTGRSVLVQGQTIGDHFYVLLTSSGEITLTGTAFFALPERDAGPLTGHLPMLRIHVASQAPVDRMLSLQPQGSEVLVHAPTDVHLVARTYILCQLSSTGTITPGGYDYWEKLATNTLRRPNCPNDGGRAMVNGQWVTTHWTLVLWKYAIGAVGYAVVQG
jgi:hypothetical protein